MNYFKIIVLLLAVIVNANSSVTPNGNASLCCEEQCGNELLICDKSRCNGYYISCYCAEECSGVYTLCRRNSCSLTYGPKEPYPFCIGGKDCDCYIGKIFELCFLTYLLIPIILTCCCWYSFVYFCKHRLEPKSDTEII
jgi:hypothetical protein